MTACCGVCSGEACADRKTRASGRPVDVLLCQADHRILDNVERRIVIPNGIGDALEGALLYALEKIGEFFVGCQVRAPRAEARKDARDYVIAPFAAAKGRSDVRTDVIMLLCTTAGS